MRRNVLAFVFAVSLLAAAAVPLFAGGGTALACHEHDLQTPGTTVEDIAGGQTDKELGDGGYHQFHVHVHKGVPGDNVSGLGSFDPGEGAFDQGGQVTVIGAPFAQTCP